jgi:hypothetical protein
MAEMKNFNTPHSISHKVRKVGFQNQIKNSAGPEKDFIKFIQEQKFSQVPSRHTTYAT